MKKNWYILLFLAALIWACSSDSNGGGSDDDGTSIIDDDDGGPLAFDRAGMLENWADNIIIPSYDSFLAVFATLQSDFDTFQGDRSEQNLLTLRSSWLQAYKSWQRISMFEIGPAEDNGLRLNVNTYPTDVTLLEDHVASGTYDFSLPSNRDTKGFPALDYLINGLGADDAEIVALYNNGTTDQAYLDYFDDVLQDIQTRVADVANAWGSTYRDTFVNNDGSSATASVDRYVNDFIFYYEKFLRAGKMGIPLGVFTGTVAPQTVESFYMEGVSNELFLEGLDAVQDFFNGRYFGSSQSGESLASYLVTLNSLKDGAALDQTINNQLNLARTMVTDLGSFSSELQNTPPTDMLLAYDEVQRAVALFKVDMVSAMSIAIDFVDADGD